MFDLSNLKFNGQLLTNVSLANYTSWRVGGEADYVYAATDLEDLKFFLPQLPTDIPLYWLGLGSNTLVRDGGFHGLVIVTQGSLNNINHNVHSSYTQVRAEAGVSAAQLARHTARLGAAGLEFMAGIPGTVGGALAMNAGCFGGETWSLVESVEMIDRNGIIHQRSHHEFTVGYRQVKKAQDEWFIAGHFKLSPGDKAQSLQKIRDLLARRNATQPTGTANCGSVFRNPAEHYAGQLIESCGLKGLRIGGARVSEKHANFILNEQNATAADIEKLIITVKEKVRELKQIELIPEVCIIGTAI